MSAKAGRTMGERLLWAALVVVVVLAVAWRAVPVDDASDRVKALPLEGLTFRGQDIPLDVVETNHFAGVTLLKRAYQAGPYGVAVLVVDGTRNRHAVHDPAYCFRGGGWQIEADSEMPLLAGAARRQVFRRGAERRELLYWFSDGAQRHASISRYTFESALRRVTFGKSAPASVLVSLQAAGAPPPDWDSILRAIPPLNSL